MFFLRHSKHIQYFVHTCLWYLRGYESLVYFFVVYVLHDSKSPTLDWGARCWCRCVRRSGMLGALLLLLLLNLWHWQVISSTTARWAVYAHCGTGVCLWKCVWWVGRSEGRRDICQVSSEQTDSRRLVATARRLFPLRGQQLSLQTAVLVEPQAFLPSAWGTQSVFSAFLSLLSYHMHDSVVASTRYQHNVMDRSQVHAIKLTIKL